jgi:putative FmdB family regulatory protein
VNCQLDEKLRVPFVAPPSEICVPLYDYQCKQCQAVIEVRHGFKDLHSEACPQCGGPLARVFNPAGIVFKGSGFYITDSRKSSGGESGGSASSQAAPATPAATEPKKTESKKSDAA